MAIEATGRTHTLKTDPDVFDAVASGAKTFEIRWNDRGYQVGDVLSLRKTRYTGAQMIEGMPLEYIGAPIRVTVTYVLHGPVYGLAHGWVIMGITTAAPRPEAVKPWQEGTVYCCPEHPGGYYGVSMLRDLKPWQCCLCGKAAPGYEQQSAPRPVPTLTYSDLARIAIECGLQSSDEHWGTVYRAVSLSQLMAFAEAVRPAEPDGGAV